MAGEDRERAWAPSPGGPVPCTALVPQSVADVYPPGWGWLCVQLEESEFTCAAAVKARKAMEVEMEDLHLQIDDIAKAKTAVRGRDRDARGRAGDHDGSCGHPTQGLSCRGFLQDRATPPPPHLHPLLPPPTRSSIERREGLAEEGTSLGAHLPA